MNAKMTAPKAARTMAADYRAERDEMEAECIALRAEVERLRVALQSVVKECGPSAGLDDEPGSINAASRIARAALKAAP